MSTTSPQSLLQLRDWTASVLCLPSDLPTKGFSNQIPLVARGNCTFYEKVRLAQGGGARGLLIVSKETLVRPPGTLGAVGTGLTSSCVGSSPQAPEHRVRSCWLGCGWPRRGRRGGGLLDSSLWGPRALCQASFCWGDCTQSLTRLRAGALGMPLGGGG